MRLIKMILFILPSVLVPNAYGQAIGKNNFLVCYGRLDPTLIKGYGLVILEPAHYSPAEIKTIQAQNETVLAYISLGEVNRSAGHYEKLKDVTLGKNSVWDSYYLDLGNAGTREVLMQLLADGFTAGYDGFFLDNFDNFGTFGPQVAQQDDLVAMLGQIYRTYPEKTFYQNAGLDIIARTAPFMDGVVIESIATDYSFADKKYRLRNARDFAACLGKLKKASEYGLPIRLIEYADSIALKNDVEERLKDLAYDYFIGQIDLQTLPKFK
jgi:hypothetical protein